MSKQWLALLLGMALAGAVHSGVYEDLLQAMRENDAERVLSLLDRGMDVNTADPSGATVLHWAVRHGNEIVLRELLARRANPNRRDRFGDTPLMLAALMGRKEMVAALLAHGAKPDLGGWNALHYAAYNGHAELIPLLLAAGAPIDQPAPNGETPLMLAARNGHLAAVRTLVGAGARVDLNGNGQTALDLAQERRHSDIVEFLRRAGGKNGR